MVMRICFKEPLLSKSNIINPRRSGCEAEQLRKALAENEELKRAIGPKKAPPGGDRCTHAGDFYVQTGDGASGKGSDEPEKKIKIQPKQNLELTYEQKKDLAQAIDQLSGPKLGKVIEMMAKVVPELHSTDKEQAVEMDSLPAEPQAELYNFIFKN
ncbi:hypothetical protein B0H14DRAFT_2581247 [Mycena olivaceomarginata]|nr:hypothetical protein B0H14DRAFT_2581247 [Mycena olivaceomarginata]